MIGTALKIEKAEGCGAIVRDVDLANLTDAEAAALRQALFDHGVLFFRSQSITPEQHIALAERFAPIDVNRFFPADAAYPMIAKVEKTEGQVVNIGGGWHTDHSYDTIPAMGSVLLAVETPPTGGDTLFADMYAAYDALDAEMQARLVGLTARHASAHVFGEGGGYAATDRPELSGHAETPEAVHPVVITHPGSGKKALYVNPSFTREIVGMPADESQALLSALYAHAMRREFVGRFSWRPGSIAIWDNRCTWHYALNDYHGHRRLMHRITLDGVPLAA